MKERLAKSVFWITWSRGLVQVVSFLSTLVVVRWLSPADYGLMAIAGIWTGILSLLSEMGIGAAIVQFQELEADELRYGSIGEDLLALERARARLDAEVARRLREFDRSCERGRARLPLRGRVPRNQDAMRPR